VTERKSTKRSRPLIMTEVDEAALTRVLLEEFPAMKFIAGSSWDYDNFPWIESIDQSNEIVVHGVVPDPGWHPELSRYDTDKFPRRNFFWARSWWDWTLPRGADWAWDPPTLEAGAFMSSYWRDDAEDRFFVNKLYRLLRKVTVNAFRRENPHLGIVHGEATGWEIFAGHDALRWCSESPPRMLDGKYRPHSEWSFPEDSPYYKGLGIFGRPVAAAG
jgi:hypothetical protein